MKKTRLVGLFMATIILSTAMLAVVPANACQVTNPESPDKIMLNNEISGTSITTVDDGDDGVAKLWVVMPLLVLVLWCIDQCQCCEDYYLNGGTPDNEPTCCDNCFSWLCE